MYRYVALFKRNSSSTADHEWNTLFAEIEQKFPGSHEVLRSDELIVLQWPDANSQMQCHILTEGRGVILGHLFTPKPDGSDCAPANRAPKTLSHIETRNIIDNNGEWLQERYWGSYVAILHNKEQKSASIYRSPFGVLSSYHYFTDNISLVFSDYELLTELASLKLSPDWTHTSMLAKHAYSFSERTPLNNLDLLQHSRMMTVDSRTVNYRYFWEPWKFSSNVFLDGYHPFARSKIASTIRNLVFSCLSTWASVCDRASLLLSGGLDSSLVAGVMSKLQNRPHLIGITYFGTGPMDDERHYAALTAKRNNITRIDIERDTGEPDLSIFNNCRKMPWPTDLVSDWKVLLKEEQISRDYGLTAKFTGDGGDVLFGLIKDNFAARDFSYDHSISLKYFRVAMHSALVSDTSFWKSLAEMIKAKLMKNSDLRPWENESDESNWALNKDIIELIRPIAYSAPWHSSNILLSPGKRGQLDTVMSRNDYVNPFPCRMSGELISPFFSQPLAEFILRVPIYVLQFDGRERGLVRSVFADCLADEIRLRQFKSHGTTLAVNMVKKNIDFFLDFLLDGILCANKIIDYRAIEMIRNEPSSATIAQYARILQMAGTESWARAWTR